MVVHGLRADLNLNRQMAGISHHRVQRLVAVGFGFGDVVVKLLGQRGKRTVHPGQRRVTGGDIGHDHAQRANVVQLPKIERLAAHFFNNAVDVLGTPLHGGVNALA